MRKAGNFASLSIFLALVLLFSLVFPGSAEPVLADPGKLKWSIVDTPGVASPSEINSIAIGSDGRTFYAVDIPGDPPLGTYPNGKVYKSTDGGVGWNVDLTRYLAADGAFLPAWNIAVAPDDVRFVVAITDGTGAPDGPRRVFISENGGAKWENTNFLSPVGEYISCVDISMKYGNDRDIAIGTRTAGGAGSVYVLKRPGFAGWSNQNWAPPAGPAVVALKFSPTYASDSSLVVISANGGTFLNLGIHDTNANTTAWNTVGGYPVLIRDTNHVESSPTAAQIITADLELPSDFSGQTAGLRRYYISTDVNTVGIPPPGVQSGVHRIDETVAYWIRPPVTAPTTGRISSIAYFGTYASGVLLAGEVNADAATGLVCVWRTSDSIAGTPTWLKSDTLKSPTGGGTSSFANAQVAWSPDGIRAYCGTSSANPTVGGTAWALTQWPRAWLNSVPRDESAFSVSPYTRAYERLLIGAGKDKDADIGNIWNQISLIDTRLSFLSDVAVLEVPEAPEEEVPSDYNVLYLASINTAVGGLDSIWRSTSDPLGDNWERILCNAATNNDIILRVKQTTYDEVVRSQGIAFANIGTDEVGYSSDEGQAWHVQHLVSVIDLALASDEIMYILSGQKVYRYKWEGPNWIKTHDASTDLFLNHTIAVPLKNPGKKDEGSEDWVIVGECGPPGGFGRVAYADFSRLPVEFQPPLERQVEVPVLGNVHVITDDKFEQNKIIYAAINDTTGTSGKIYRWKIDESTAWDELGPPNNAFYGLAQRNNVLYGAWDSPGPPRPPEPPNNPPGVDRTLYPRDRVPPPPGWDDLTTGLPVPGAVNFPVAFTREPSSLKISSNEYNNLWAIDNNPYNWTNKTGCLWAYTDTVAKAGPWTTSPASGDFVPVDPVTGRANEINFGWRQLSYASLYELQLAKDSGFSIQVLRSDNITPVDQLAPECYFPSGGLVPAPASGVANWGNLESNHRYYWRVRARAAATGEIIRSPWSATMYFTVMAGLPVRAKYPTLTLFNPPYGARNVSPSVGFSWSPMPGTTKYEFILAKDAALAQVIVKANVPTTAYIYGDKLDWNTTYFWQVRAIEPVVSDPSPIGSFTVVAKHEPAAAVPKKPLPIPSWVWVVIAIYAALMVTILAFVMVKPRYVIRRRAAAASEIDPLLEGRQNPIARIWNAVIMGIRRRRYLRKPKDAGHDNSWEE